MTLLDLRRYAIRNRTRVHFTLEPAGECVVNEHGVLKLPSLGGVPDFRVDSSLAGVEQFVLATVGEPSRTQKVSREELRTLLGDAPKADHEHEE